MGLGAAPAIWFDGETAARREVTVGVEAGALVAREAGTETLRWPLAEVRKVRDPGSPGAVTVYRSGDAADARLSLIDPTDARALAAVAPDLTKVDVARGTWPRVLLWGAGAGAALAVTLLVLIPALADTLARLIPPETEARIGDGVLAQVEGLLSDDDESWVCSTPAGDRALSRMTGRLVADETLRGALTVAVVDHPMPNAFAAPGGRVVLFRGLLEMAETPEELAAVLAHEIGHVVHRDPTRLALRSAGSAGLLSLALGDATGGAFAAVMAEAALGAGHSRAAETGADDFAHAMLTDAELPPEALGTLFARLEEIAPDTDGVLRHFMSHPALADRIAAAEAAGGEGEMVARLIAGVPVASAVNRLAVDAGDGGGA